MVINELFICLSSQCNHLEGNPLLWFSLWPYLFNGLPQHAARAQLLTLIQPFTIWTSARKEFHVSSVKPHRFKCPATAFNKHWSLRCWVLRCPLIQFSSILPYISVSISLYKPSPLSVWIFLSAWLPSSVLCLPPLCLADGKSMTHFSLNSLHLVLYYRPQGPPPFNYSCWAQHYI